MDPDDLEEQLELHDGRVQKHGVDWAEQALRDRRGAEAEAIITEYRARIGKLLHVDRGLTNPGLEGWYLPKPDHESPRWAYARTQLGLPREVVEQTARVSDEILARLGNPKGPSITTRGLVLGHVQSGKTTSFLSVAAKATDNDYDLVIVLAGVHNSLRRQTQDRAARTLVHKKDLWWQGTVTGDFRADGNSLSSHLSGHGKRGLLVVKKHQTILRRLADWLEEESDASLRSRAVLVIDDEADQAGLDVSRGDELEGVHKQLRRIVDLKTSDGERRCAYLAYTATPYANILTSQDDYGLYPRDFIYPLDKPASYVGSEELFGDEQVGDPVQIEADVSNELLTDGLRDAIRWFVLATAARAALTGSLESFHSSMLVHTTQKTETQAAYQPAIEQYLAELAQEFANDESMMRAFYERALDQVPARPGGGDGYVDETVAPWAAVRSQVQAVLTRLITREPAGESFIEDGHLQQAHSGVIVDNSKVEWKDRLTYSDLGKGQPSVTVIAIGGNTLSRGLTLEGLVCSYFARTTRTYDSLMQMGRWFGYRPGYRHLLRVWTTQDLYDWFRELNQVEQDLRDELTWMQEHKLKPAKYGPRIRVSPNMNITRAAAMRSVSRQISYSDTLVDPAWLDLDSDALQENQRLARALAIGLGTPDPRIAPSRVFRGVPLERIADFLFSFRFHEDEKRVDLPSLRKYVDTEVNQLQHWNVIYKSVSKGQSASPFDFGGDVGVVNTVTRARVEDSSVAYIQSLVDSNDHRMDIGADPDDTVRYRSRHEPPLLIVYAIDPVSEPRRGSLRVRLDAPTTPVSVSLALPQSDSAVEYVSPVVTTVEEPPQPDLGDYGDE